MVDRLVSCLVNLPPSARITARSLLSLVFILSYYGSSFAQENPYIVTYDHYLEEPGNLEVEYFSTIGTQRGGNDFHAFWAEFEYGATAWWTTELYIDGQTWKRGSGPTIRRTKCPRRHRGLASQAHGY